jgi:NAD(P)-dependent dehydrogenase (short-subunit alcohol dehydrogenase family)
MSAGSEGTIIVTGASRGIGRATVRALVLDHGRSVLAVSRDRIALESLEVECSIGPGMLRTLSSDLTRDGAISEVLGTIRDHRVMGLVNNAGLLIKRPIGEWKIEDLGHLFRANLFVPLLLSQALASQLDGDPPGHVVNLGSMGGFQGSVKFPGLAGYSSSKAALANLTECLAEEWKGRGIRCNCLAIGAVDTAMMREAFPGYRAPVTADEAGAFVARFALEGHRMFNGKILPMALSTP